MIFLFNKLGDIMLPYLNIFGVKIASYGLCMLLGIVVVALLSIRQAKKKEIKLEDHIIIMAFVIAFFIFCAWLLYIIVTYSFRDIINLIFNKDFSFLNEGGLVFYGGFIGGILGAFIGIRVTKTKPLYVEDILVPYIPIGHAIGRIGCFLAGCCRGIEYEGIFSVKYKFSLFGEFTKGYFPTQLLEAMLNVFIFISLLKYRKRKRKTCDLLFAYILEYSLVRFFIEYLRGDSIRGIYLKLSTSQWISIVLVFVAGLYYIMRTVCFKNRNIYKT